MAAGYSNLLGIILPIGVPIGIACTPISLGIGGSGW